MFCKKKRGTATLIVSLNVVVVIIIKVQITNYQQIRPHVLQAYREVWSTRRAQRRRTKESMKLTVYKAVLRVPVCDVKGDF